MTDIRLAYSDRVRYTLQNKISGSLVIDEPLGWNDDDKEYARNKEYDGIFAKFSNNLTFIGDSADYINQVRNTQGVLGKIRLIKDEKDENEQWVRSYTGFLDMPTWSSDNGKVKLKFNSGGLQEKIKTRLTDKIELEALENLEGEAIEALQLEKLLFEGRKVFLDTRFNILPTANETKLRVESNAGNTRSQHGSIPLNLFYDSHELAQSPIPLTVFGDENIGTTGIMF